MEYNAFISFYENSCEEIKNTGRVKMYVGQCYTMVGNIEKAEEFINEKLLVPDVREGEYSISNCWVLLKKAIMARDKGVDVNSITDAEVLLEYPVPYSIDFRMHPTPIAKKEK